MKIRVMVAAAGLCVAACSLANAESGLVDEVRKPTRESLAGKKVVYVPMAMSFDLTEGWGAVMMRQAKEYGYSLEVRDANWSTDVGTRALEQAILEKPDVLVVHNFDVASYARSLRKAQQAGIKVVQVNMKSSFQTDAFVGADWYGIGKYSAERMIKVCGKSAGKSGKISIVQGQATAAASVYQLNGISDTLKDNRDIEVVSSQTADWDPSKARAITQTVIQQHPDLCGVIGFWDVMDAGTGAAAKESAKNIYVLTSGGGNKTACQAVENGTFTEVLSYDVPGQGRDLNDAISLLLQSAAPAGLLKFAFYSPNASITKQTMTASSCWDLDTLKR